MEGPESTGLPASDAAARQASAPCSRRADASTAVYAIIAVGAALAVFAPVTANFLHVDDFCHFFNAANESVLWFVLRPWGGHVQLFRNAVLWAMFHAFGMHLWLYFTVILGLHGLNVLLLYRLLRRCTGSGATAGIAAGIWGTSPLHTETLGWLSVFGQVALATIVLTLLTSIDRARERGETRPRDVATWITLALLATTSFGMGLSVALLLPMLVVLLGPVRRPAGAPRLALWATPAVALVVYFVVRTLVPSPVGSLVDSTVTVPAALGAWRFVVDMWAALVTYGLSALSLGFFGARVDRAATARSVLAVLVALIVGAGVWRMTPLDRRRVAGFAAIALVSYALVASGRAPFLQLARFVPTKAAAVARYHYFPTIGLTLTLALAVRALTPVAMRVHGAGAVAVVAWVWLTVLGFGLHRPRIDHYERERRETMAALSEIRSRVAAVPPQTTIVIPNRPFGPAQRVPCEVSGLAGLHLFALGGPGPLDGRTVRFAVSPAEWEAARASGGRVSSLLVPEKR